MGGAPPDAVSATHKPPPVPAPSRAVAPRKEPGTHAPCCPGDEDGRTLPPERARPPQGTPAMLTRLLHEAGGLRTFAVILESGDEAMSSLDAFAREEELTGAQITAIGAFENAVLAYFDWPTKQYEEIPVDEQVEVASLVGDIGVDEDGKPALHIHIVLGRRDGRAVAGHLLRARVRPTLEVLIVETPRHLTRRRDNDSGLNLIRF